MTGASKSRLFGRARAFAWHPLLFAAYPVLFLWSQNLGEAGAPEVLPLLAVVVGITALALVILAVVLRDERRAALVVSPVILALLMFGHTENLLGSGQLRVLVQVGGWLVLIALGVIAALRLREARLREVGRLLDGVAAVLVAVSLAMIVPAQAAALSEPPAETGAPPITARSNERPLRDVYYLILDRYGSDCSYSLRYDLDSELTPWLAEHGFQVLPDAHANYVRTTLSLGSTLNMTHLDALASRMGPDSSSYLPVQAMIEDSRVARQFKALGYRYIHVGSYFGPTRTDRAADQNLYLEGPSDFAAALYDASALPALGRRLPVGFPSRDERLYRNKVYAFPALNSLRDVPGPKFVFAHLLVPHPPMLVARDGSFRGSEERGVRWRQRFLDQLGWTNDQLRSWVSALQSLPEARRPIIILQGDEGPYPAGYQEETWTYDWADASPTDLEIKFGILNAWYLPDGTDPGLYDSLTSVNTFPVLFSGYFGLDIPRLDDRVATSPRSRPYQYTDVTDNLASCAG